MLARRCKRSACHLRVAHQIHHKAQQACTNMTPYPLRDSQLGDPRVHDIKNYIVKARYGRRSTRTSGGAADRRSRQGRHRVPNDLLRELDRMEFYVYETHELSRPGTADRIHHLQQRKELPDAFLRRCFFHYIRFPDKETMRRSSTCTSRHQEAPAARGAGGILRGARVRAEEEAFHLGTARLAQAPARRRHPPKPEEQGQEDHHPPLHGALLKNEQDVHLFERLIFMSRHNR